MLDMGNENKKATNSNKKNIKLSEREFEIAQYLSKGMRVSKIAEKLDRRVSTISTIKKSIFTKLEVDSVVKLADAMGMAEA